MTILSCLASVLLLHVAATTPQSPPVAVPPELQTAVERFYHAQEIEDIDAYLALWSPRAPVRPTAAQLKFIFDNGDDVFSDLRIVRLLEAGDRARVRVAIERARTTWPGGRGVPVVARTTLQASLTFEREGGEWKLLREGSAADDLAQALMEAQTADARDALLGSEPELIGTGLLGALARLGGAAAIAQDYRRSQSVFEQMALVARTGGFRKEEGEALQNIGNALYFQRRFPEALSTYEQRLVLEQARGDDGAAASAMTGIGTVRYAVAEYAEALVQFSRALAIQERLDDAAGVAFTSLSVGNIMYLQGDYDAAVRAYGRSLELNRSMFNADGESRALEGIARVNIAQGDYAGALEALQPILRDTRMQQLPGRLAAVAQSLGDVHIHLGNPDAAKRSYERARAAFEAARDTANAGRAMQGVALAEILAARYAVAAEIYRGSRGVCTKAEDAECAAAAIAGLAYAEAAQDRFREAAEAYVTAVKEFTAIDRTEDAARAEVGLSQALAGAGLYEGAVGAAVRARRAAAVARNDDLLWRALTAEARATRQLSGPAAALDIARAANDAVIRMEAAALEKPGATVAADAGMALVTLAVLQAQTGDAPGALATSEHIRSIRLRAALAASERDIARGLTADEREQERAAAARVLTAAARVTRERSLPKPDAARIAALEQTRRDAIAARGALLARLFERVPDLPVRRGLRPANAEAAVARLLAGPDEIIVSFLMDDEDLLVLLVSGTGTVDAHLTHVKRRAVAESVAALQEPDVLEDAARWSKAAGEFTALIPPLVLERLEAASKVFVVPHDVLWRVPFDALPVGSGLLADHATVVIGGSIEMLAHQAPLNHDRGGTVLVAGAPDLTPERVALLKEIAPSWTLRTGDLAPGEVEPGSPQPVVLSGSAATEGRLRANLGDAIVIHVAAPFRVNAASPLYSPILLSAATSGAQDDDGTLDLREVMNLDVKARLIVLSDPAALSMRDAAAGAGVLEWAWLTAGVPAVLVRRWDHQAAADDGASSVPLLARVRDAVANGASPAAALRAAQQALRLNESTAAPRAWAGWLLLGGQ